MSLDFQGKQQAAFSIWQRSKMTGSIQFMCMNEWETNDIAVISVVWMERISF